MPEFTLKDLIPIIANVAIVIALYYQLKNIIDKKADKTEVNKIRVGCVKHDNLRKDFDEHKRDFNMHVNSELWEERFKKLSDGQDKQHETSTKILELITESMKNRREDNGES